MLDLFAIVVSSVAIWLVLARAVSLDRTEAWFQKVTKPVRRETPTDPDTPVWRRRS